MTDPDAVSDIERWLERTVVALDLRPFAAAPLREGAVRIVEATDDGFESAMRAVLDEAALLLESTELETTLVVYTADLDRFAQLLDLIAALEAALQDLDLADTFQLVGFHPRYQFADAPVDDPANFTNRAPYPVVQLLRVESVAEAVERHPDIDAVFRRNVDLLRNMGLDEVRERWGEAFRRDGSTGNTEA